MKKIAINFDHSDNTIVFKNVHYSVVIFVTSLMRKLEKKHEMTKVYQILLTEFSDMFYEDTNIYNN